MILNLQNITEQYCLYMIHDLISLIKCFLFRVGRGWKLSPCWCPDLCSRLQAGRSLIVMMF